MSKGGGGGGGGIPRGVQAGPDMTTGFMPFNPSNILQNLTPLRNEWKGMDFVAPALGAGGNPLMSSGILEMFPQLMAMFGQASAGGGGSPQDMLGDDAPGQPKPVASLSPTKGRGGKSPRARGVLDAAMTPERVNLLSMLGGN